MKKAILLFAFILPIAGFCQVKGNGNIVTEQFDIAELNRLQMELYAQVTVDASAEPGITITADENLIPLLNYDIRDGRMVLQQREWIQPSQAIVITLGAPALSSVEVGVHETVKVINLDREDFSARALLGKVELSGQVTQLNAGGERGTVDARMLQTEVVDVNLWDQGLIQIGEAKRITGLAQQAGQVVYANPDTRVAVRQQQGASVLSETEVAQLPAEDHRFIQFQLRNNSGKRIQCYVSGPKPEGGRFSYGFPMNPGQTRDKDWSIGSKVYLVTALGTRKLLYEIKPEDEGQVVKLYEN